MVNCRLSAQVSLNCRNDSNHKIGPARGGQAAHPRRGVAHRREYRAPRENAPRTRRMLLIRWGLSLSTRSRPKRRRRLKKSIACQCLQCSGNIRELSVLKRQLRLRSKSNRKSGVQFRESSASVWAARFLILPLFSSLMGRFQRQNAERRGSKYTYIPIGPRDLGLRAYAPR
jgi:hypothetical protein